MLRSAEELRGYTIAARDGEIGSTHSFLFDDQQWVVRYLVVNTGNWLTRQLVLLSPMSLQRVDHDARALVMDVLREQVQNSPDIDTDRPVSRQQERDVLSYYGHPGYWGGGSLWGASLYPGHIGPTGMYILPGVAATNPVEQRADVLPDHEQRRDILPDLGGDPNLRSTRHMTGYTIVAKDGNIGQVADFIIDDQRWDVNYLVVDTGTWLPGRKVLLAPGWVSHFEWENSNVAVDMTREQVKNSPTYDPDAILDQAAEDALYAYYGQRRNHKTQP